MSTITTLASGDNGASSRTTINTNFTNLNNEKIETSALDTDTTLSANSDSKIPSQKAVKAYVDGAGSSSTAQALAGGGDFGTPSSSNKFITEEYVGDGTRTTYTSVGSPFTWTKRAGVKKIYVQLWGAGGSGAVGTVAAAGGAGGGYVEKWFAASELGATETLTVSAGGASIVLAGGGAQNGVGGGNTTFGALLTAFGGAGGLGGTTGQAGANGGSSFAANAGTVDAGAAGTSGGTAGGNGTSGGAGSGGANGATVGAAGLSIYGGGAGGSVSTTVLANAGGVSKYGGAGGAGVGSSTNGVVVATAGANGGGGGGGAASGTGSRTSGAGGSGLAIITEFYA